jgi:small-conductance mechanosensitive channel
MHSLWWTVVAVVGAMVLALVAAAIVHAAFVRAGRKSLVSAELAAHAHRPFQVFAALLTGRVVLQLSPVGFELRHGLLHVWGIAVILSGAWLVAAVLLALEDVAEDRYSFDVPDNRYARRIRTQVVVMRRLTIAAIIVITLGFLLMTFPEVRAIGASLLASAGVIGIVAALAAQSLLSNVIAGLQLAFSDAVRLDDVVVVEGEWAKVEEITLSHVVLQIWDDRRLILPTSYFTTKPYQNWTRTKAEVLGTVEFDVDWTIDVPGLRKELDAMVDENPKWDRRVCQLDVIGAVDGVVRLRALLSAGDAGSLWDLRCAVREHMVAWIRDEQPGALPRTRAEIRNEKYDK